MRYNRLGKTGLFVSELCFGTMTFGGGEGIWGKIGSLQQQEAERLIARSLEAGNQLHRYSGCLRKWCCGKNHRPGLEKSQVLNAKR